jgi:hypothetical protein
MNNLFLDTEFWAIGHQIHPISIGLCDIEGRTFYREFHFTLPEDADDDSAGFLRQHVLPKLGKDVLGWTNFNVCRHLKEWIDERSPCRIWAWFGAYDWVVFCQIFGGMRHIPEGVQHRYWELANLHPTRAEKPKKSKQAHHALVDAQWNRQLYLNMTGGFDALHS